MHDPRVDQPYVVERWPKAHVAPSSPRALVAAEVGLLLVTAAAVFSFTRVFDSSAFVLPVGASALTAHAAAALLRRRHWRAWLAIPSCALAVVLISAAASVRRSVRADFSEAWSVVNNTRAPVPPTRVLVFAASLLIGLAVVVADSLAFRRRALFGALVPGVLAFGLSAMYGDDHHRLASIVALAVASVCFALAHRVAFFDRGGGWMVDRSPSQRRYVMSGLALASCALVAALAVGPSLPGAQNEALVAWRDIGNGWGQQDDDVTLAPLVSVRAQLVEQSDREVFTVQAARADYWRLTSLDVFDGVTWSASDAATATVTLPVEAPADALRQVVTIEGLRGNWLPAALTAVAVDVVDDDTVTFESSTATLQLDDRLDKGDTYTVWSSATADTSLSSSEARSLPRGVRQQLTPLVNQIVRDAGAVTAIDKARSLESYFLTNFTYDLQVAAGSSITDIASFLDRRSGYCEQFAATFAAMARVLGIPSRVAIGYRVGTFDERSNEFVVIGRDAHAWPEVYFAGLGWVRFDPTPGGANGAAAPTGSPATVAADAPVVTEGSAEVPTTTIGETTAPDELPADGASVDGGSPAQGGAGGGSIAAAVVLVVVVLMALPVALDVARRRRDRQRVRHDPRALIVWWWRDALRWLHVAGAEVRTTETPLEVASRAGPVLAPAAAQITSLAQRVTEACYSAEGPTPWDLDAAADEVASIGRCAKAKLGRTWRLRRYLAQVRGIA